MTKEILQRFSWVVVSFIFGFLMNKKVGRHIVKTWKRLNNEPITLNLFSVRIYKNRVMNPIKHEVFHDMQTSISNLKLVSLGDKTMQVNEPTFGNIKIILTPEQDIDDEEEERVVEAIKISISLENPFRVGSRGTSILYEYYSIINTIFGIMENVLLEKLELTRNYAVAEISRTGWFKEEKNFEVEDEDLSAHIHATTRKITVVVDPPNHIVKVVEKYLLV